MREEITRREFVTGAAAVAAGIALAGASGCTAPKAEKAKVETPSRSYGGGDTMSEKILVGYATRTGSSVGVAEAIGQTLAARGYQVDVMPLRERPSLEGYDGAVIGSAVNGGQWLPEAVAYVESNAAALGRIPVAAFCVHIMNAGDDSKATKRRLAYLDKVRAVVDPVSEGFFLGKGPTAEDSSLIMRWAFKVFGGSGEGDCRDWDAIRSWAAAAKV